MLFYCQWLNIYCNNIIKMVKKTSHSVTIVDQLTEIVGPQRTVAPLVVPPDGGWGWVIMVVGLFGSSVVDGTLACFYLFREPMSRDLHTNTYDIILLSAITISFYFLGEIIACSFASYWGFRITMVLGAIGASTSFAFGNILNNLVSFYVLPGAFGGLMLGFVMVGATLPAGFYFDKKRAIVMGIVYSGTGFGTVFMPHIIKNSLRSYGWRGTYLVQAGLIGILMFFGLLIRPLKPVMVLITQPPPTRRVTDETMESIDLTRYSPVETTQKEQQSVIDWLALEPHHNNSPTTSMSTARTLSRIYHPTIAQISDPRVSINIIVGSNVGERTVSRLQSMNMIRSSSPLTSQSPTVEIIQEPSLKISLPWYKCGCCRSKYVALPHRALLRNDLYYTGNLTRLPEYTTQNTDLEYHMYVTKVPTYYETVLGLTHTYTLWCCRNILSGLGFLVDYTWLKSPVFICLALCGLNLWAAYFIPILFTCRHLEVIGKEDQTSDLVSVMGMGVLLGRALSGIIITAFPRFGARSTCSFNCFIAGIAIICYVLHDSIVYKATCLFVYGFSIGFFTPLRSIIIVDFFGLSNLTSVTGMILLFITFGIFFGLALAGGLMILTGSKNVPFYVCGCLLFFAGMSLWPMRKLQKWEQPHARRSTSSTA